MSGEVAPRPGTQAPPPAGSFDATCDHEAGCITCGDVAIAMRVVRLDDDRALALCEAETGERETVEVGLVEPVAAGDTLLVHAATALARLDGTGAEEVAG